MQIQISQKSFRYKLPVDIILSIMKKIANIISIIGHPLLTIPIFILIVMSGFESFPKASLIAFLIVGCVFIPVILRMYIKSKNGTYTNFDVSDRTQRKSLFLFAIPLLLVVTVILFATNQSRTLCISVLFALILLIVSQVTNFYIKSSLHVSLNIYLSSLIFTVNYKIGIAVLLFTVLIGWSRVQLGRHTKKEVLFGLIIGVLISLIMLVFEGYIHA
jgi:membrane-associated phospholipid phosphatase